MARQLGRRLSCEHRRLRRLEDNWARDTAIPEKPLDIFSRKLIPSMSKSISISMSILPLYMLGILSISTLRFSTTPLRFREALPSKPSTTNPRVYSSPTNKRHIRQATPSDIVTAWPSSPSPSSPSPHIQPALHFDRHRAHHSSSAHSNTHP